MRIAALEATGFGAWTGLKLPEISPEMTVIYGHNEAGKTTLLELVRSILFGFAPDRRRRYLPPVNGGLPGGWLALRSGEEAFEVRRIDRVLHSAAGELSILDGAGRNRGEQLLPALLGEIDEPTFNHVFAVGLREIQELSTLGDSAVAERLYRLTTGLDRVSLLDCARELGAARRRVLSDDEQPSLVTQLNADRARLRTEVRALRADAGQHSELTQECGALDRREEQLQEELRSLAERQRLWETALALAPLWHEREQLRQQHANLSGETPLPASVLDELHALDRRLARYARRGRAARQAALAARKAYRDPQTPPTLLDQGPRPELVAEQLTHAQRIEHDVRLLEIEIKELKVRLEEQPEPEPVRPPPTTGPVLSENALRALQPIAKSIAIARRKTAEAEEALKQKREQLAAVDAQLPSRAPVANVAPDLQPALEKSGNLVVSLRQRAQLEEKLASISQHETALEIQCKELLQRQLLPGWLVFAAGLVFVIGVVMLLAGLFMPESVVGEGGLTMALFGGIMACGSGAWKFMMERSAATELESTQEQLESLRKQRSKAEQEREALDGNLPSGGGPVTARLQAAERELASLEGSLGIEARRKAVQASVDAAQQELERLLDALRQGRRRWSSALTAHGLPPNLTPRELRQLEAETPAQAPVSPVLNTHDEVRRALHRRQRELEERRNEQHAIAARAARWLTASGLRAVSERLVDQLQQLHDEHERKTHVSRRRGRLRRQARRARSVWLKQAKLYRRWKRRRQRRLAELGATDQVELKRRVDLAEQIAGVQAGLGRLDRQIHAALGPFAEEQIGQELTAAEPHALQLRLDEARAQRESLQREQRELAERRGRLAQQLAELAANRRLAVRRLDLSLVEERLRQGRRRWQKLAIGEWLLNRLRKRYESERQPECLQEASRYLQRFTEGAYVRVWTPLDDDVLLVDDRDGKSLPVEVLSCGTREQLFLSLRLALVAGCKRRGIELPLILDDVLVNYDLRRARAAATALRDFAAEGHQVLMFTCHDHLFRTFKSLKVHCLQLPGNELLSGEEQVARQEKHVEKPVEKPVERVERTDKPERPVRPRKPKVEREEEPAPAEPVPAPVPIPVVEAPPLPAPPPQPEIVVVPALAQAPLPVIETLTPLGPPPPPLIVAPPLPPIPLLPPPRVEFADLSGRPVPPGGIEFRLTRNGKHGNGHSHGPAHPLPPVPHLPTSRLRPGPFDDSGWHESIEGEFDALERRYAKIDRDGNYVWSSTLKPLVHR